MGYGLNKYLLKRGRKGKRRIIEILKFGATLIITPNIAFYTEIPKLVPHWR